MRKAITASIVVSLFIVAPVSAIAGNPGGSDQWQAPHRPIMYQDNNQHRSGWPTQHYRSTAGMHRDYPLHVGTNSARYRQDPMREHYVTNYDQSSHVYRHYEHARYEHLRYRSGPIRYAARPGYDLHPVQYQERYEEQSRIPYRYVVTTPGYPQDYYVQAPRSYEYVPGLGATPTFVQYAPSPVQYAPAPVQYAPAPTCTCQNY